MPHFRIETNVPKSKIPEKFLSETASVIAKILGKPVGYCVVTVVPDTMMSWAGTSDPCAIASLLSIGQLGIEENKKHSKALFEHVNKQLGIAPDRMYITFNDALTENVGYTGTTFHDIFGGK